MPPQSSRASVQPPAAQEGGRGRSGAELHLVQSTTVRSDALLRRLGLTWRLLIKELSAFGIVGAVCFFMDIGLFQLFYAHVGLGAVTAKLLSTLVSTTAAYVGHRYWSFSHRARTGVKREYLLFAAINGATLLLSVGVVALVRYPLQQDSVVVLQIANIAAIVAGTVLRYLAYRRWVFPAHEDAGQAAARASVPVSDAA